MPSIGIPRLLARLNELRGQRLLRKEDLENATNAAAAVEGAIQQTEMFLKEIQAAASEANGAAPPRLQVVGVEELTKGLIPTQPDTSENDE